MDAKDWYRRDDNAVPPVHELHPRGDDDEWYQTVEPPLLCALEEAANQTGLDAQAEGTGNPRMFVRIIDHGGLCRFPTVSDFLCRDCVIAELLGH